MELQGKCALITGSTSGIGLGIAQCLAVAGANIMLNGFGDQKEIERIQQQLASYHGATIGYDDANLMDAHAARNLVTTTAKTLGGIDILVNNAGIQHVANIEDFPMEKWDAIMALNLSAVFHTTAAVTPIFKRQQWGRIINIASAHGLVASAGKAAYVAAKHAVVGLTKVTALELADQSSNANITANAICPGWVLTPLVQKQVDAIAQRESIPEPEARVKLLSEKQPAKRFATPEEIGSMATYLCSDGARMITGTTLSVDGGWTAQ